MPSVEIRRLASLNARDDGTTDTDRWLPFETVLKAIYFPSEFIDPIEAIAAKIEHPEEKPVSLPFGAFYLSRAIGFFTLDFSNPPVAYATGREDTCWLDSFMVGRDFQRKGFATAILKRLPGTLRTAFPFIRHLNLTVNFQNQAALALYRQCGFEDTDEVYQAGPAGPQHIFTKRI